MCDKAYFDLKNFRLWELTHELLALNLPLYISPTPSNPYPARHIPSFGRAWGGFPSWLSEPPISHRILSHPLLRRGLGRLLLFGFGPPSLVRALFLFVNFFPSCFPIYALLRCKTCPFALQKMPFYHAKGHLLHGKRASFRNGFVMYWMSDGYKPLWKRYFVVFLKISFPFL